MAEVEALRAELATQIKWYDDHAQALEYFKTHDWEGDYCWHQEETRQFIEQAKTLLEVAA